MNAKATEALLASHMEAHRLLALLAEQIDSVNPDDCNWGHVGDMNYVVGQLRETLGLEG